MRENYFWHKIHSLTGIIPTGFYLAQHLSLNTFSLGGPDKFNAVILFFEGMPKHLLFLLKYGIIWPALLFHAIYGMFIISRSKGNYSQASLKFRENRYYSLQRWSGIFAFIFLAWHMASTSIIGQIQGADVIMYSTWADRLAAPNGTYLMLAFYILGILASTYHFAYGIWNFCIRWGITVNETSQQRMARFSQVAFVALSLLGIMALVGFFNPALEQKHHSIASTQAQVQTQPASLDN